MPTLPLVPDAIFVHASAGVPDDAGSETQEQPALLYPGFPTVSLTGFLREIPDGWLIWYARSKDAQ
jgi:hypothetical protein